MPVARLDLQTAAGRRTDGYTLVELVMVTVVLGVLAVLGTSLFVENFRSTRYSNADNALDAEARYVMERLSREIRAIKYDASNTNVNSWHYCVDMAPTAIAFQRINRFESYVSDCTTDPLAVTVSSQGSNLLFNSGGASAPLTQQLAGFHLNYFDASGATATNNMTVQSVGIELTLSSGATGATSTQSTRVGLRNR